jgi:alpha-L-fucosidase
MGEFRYTRDQRVKRAPVIKKLGAISPALMEQTPIIWNGELLLVESVTEGGTGPEDAVHCLRVRNPETGKRYKTFGHNYYYASAYTENGIVYAFATNALDNGPFSMFQSDDPGTWHNPSGGHEVHAFWSADLENWRQETIITIPEWRLWNTSVCKGPDGYVMAIEVMSMRERDEGPDPVVGHPFTVFFAESEDLHYWEMMPNDCCYTRDRYNACPALRYSEGWYYMICLEALPAQRYAPYIYRTKNFVDWEVGFHNPMMMWGDDDRKIKEGCPELFDEHWRELLETGLSINCSDLDLCEYQGKTHIFYTNGNQMTWSFLLEAVYDGPLALFLRAFFE